MQKLQTAGGRRGREADLVAARLRQRRRSEELGRICRIAAGLQYERARGLRVGRSRAVFQFLTILAGPGAGKFFASVSPYLPADAIE